MAAPSFFPSGQGPHYGPLPGRFIAPKKELDEDFPRNKRPVETIIDFELIKKEPKSNPLSLITNGNATIGDLAALISAEGKWPLQVEPEEAERKGASMTLTDVNWFDAVITLGRLNGLAVTANGERIITETSSLKPGDVVTLVRFDTLLDRQQKIIKASGATARIAAERHKLAAEERAERSLRQTESIVSKSFHLRYADPEEVANYLKALFAKTAPSNQEGAERQESVIQPRASPFSTTPTFAIFNQENLLTVTATPLMLERVTARIAEIDTPPRQVFIEARIVEVQRDSVRDLGVEWGGVHSQVTPWIFPNAIAAGGAGNGQGASAGPVVALPPIEGADPATGALASGAGVGVTISDVAGTLILRSRLYALEQAGLSRTLSNPKVVALNGGRAVIKSGREIPYYASSANQGPSVQFKEAVISLDVTPQVMDDQRIRIKIEARKDEVDPGVTVQGAPAIKKKEIVTQVILPNGGSAILGGVFEGEKGSIERQVPWFHKIPIIGWLFRSRRAIDNELELLVFITPTLLPPQEEGS